MDISVTTPTPTETKTEEITPFQQNVLEILKDEPGLLPSMALETTRMIEQHPQFKEKPMTEQEVAELVQITLYEEQAFTFNQAVEKAGEHAQEFKERLLGIGEEKENRLESTVILNAMVGKQEAVDKVNAHFSEEERSRFSGALTELTKLKENYSTTYDSLNEIVPIDTIEVSKLNACVEWMQELFESTQEFFEMLDLNIPYNKLQQLVKEARERLAIGRMAGASWELRTIFNRMSRNPAFGV